MFRDYGLPLLVSAYFFALGIVTVARETSFAVYGSAGLWLLAVAAVQLLIALGARRLYRGNALRYGLMSFFVAANAIAFYLAFFERLISQGPAVQIPAGLGIWATVWVALYLCDRQRVVRTVLSTILVAITVYTVVDAAFLPRKTPAAATGDLAPYGDIVLGRKPNVHLIAVDSMLPEALAKRHLGIQTEYDRFMREHHAVVFRNLFASDVPTVPSLSSVVRLADVEFSGRDGFAGRVLHPLYHIFKNNGYKIASGYNNRAFGDKGPFVDQYANQETWSGRVFSESALCKYQSAVERVYQLYGFCQVVARLEPDRGLSWEDEVVERIGAKRRSPTPWLTLHYVYSLGHTAGDYETRSRDDFEEYRHAFLNKQRSLAADWLPKLAATIAAKEPDSIVFLFGDHGPWLSRTVTKKERPRFWQQDRFGIFGAVMNTDDPCVAENTLTHYFEGFGTPERVIAGIVRCLAANPEAVDHALNFPEQGSFRRFLYE